MSDPTTNREIEDVLSSIRRLVSQERVVAKPAEPAPARGEGALMLTPALRVIEGDGGQPADPAIAADPEDGPDDGIAFHSGRIRGDTMLAALGSVGRLGRGDRAGDAPEEPRARPDALADAAPDAASGAQAAADDADDEFAVDSWGDDPADTTLEATIAELEAAVAGIDTEFEPDGGEDPGGEEAGADAVWFGVAEAAPVPVAPGSDDVSDTAAPPAPEAGSDWSSDLPGNELGEGAEWDFGPAAAPPVATIAATDGESASGAIGSRRLHLASDAGDMVIAPADRVDDPGRAGIADPHPAEEQPEPVRSRIFVRRSASPDDEVDTGTSDASAPDWSAPADLAVHAGPDETAGDDEYDDAADLADLDLGLLRQIVSDMIRQELRGPLGERITQNVRKLVRREVMRALESRDFE